MKIPDRVKIFGHEYSVELGPYLFRDDNTGGGKSCANSLEIAIASDSPESNQAEIFLHEIIEQLRYRLQIDLKHRELAALSEGLFNVIRDNNLDFRNNEISS